MRKPIGCSPPLVEVLATSARSRNAVSKDTSTRTL